VDDIISRIESSLPPPQPSRPEGTEAFANEIACQGGLVAKGLVVNAGEACVVSSVRRSASACVFDGY
jgi:hypothetical protein